MNKKTKYKMWYINAIICKHIKKEYFANKILNTIQDKTHKSFIIKYKQDKIWKKYIDQNSNL